MSEEKYAVITGASSGIGLECARILAEKGYQLVIVARRSDRMQILADELRTKHQSQVHVLTKDLAHPQAAQEIFDYTEGNNLKVEVLVNNAGFGLYGNFVQHTAEEINRMLQVNVVALTNLTHLFAKAMAQHGTGYILQVSSVGAFQPSPYYAPYSATKSYVMLFGEALDYELRAQNVSVTTLYPGATKSEFHAVAKHKAGKLVEMTKMTAHEVAAAGIKAMFTRRRSITPGLINKVNEVLIKFLPRRVGTAIAGTLMKLDLQPPEHRS